MIKPNELRIGNRLYFYKPLESEKQILIVTGIFEEDNIYFVSSKEYAPINIETGVMPIPITPEILKRIEFNENPLKSYDTYFSIENDKLYFNTEVGERCIENLHQFQNLYYALTSNELNYNEHL